MLQTTLSMLTSSFLLPIIVRIPHLEKPFLLPIFLNDIKRVKTDVANAFYAVFILDTMAVLSIAMLYVSKLVMSKHASNVDDQSKTRFRGIEHNIA